MGRRPKNVPKGIPLGINRLTEKQAKLLGWIYIMGYKDASVSEVYWGGAKTLLSRSPTPSESATLSKRMQALEAHGLVHRQGRLVSLTEEGRRLLYAYAVEQPRSIDKPILLSLLEREKITRELETYAEFQLIIARHFAKDGKTLEAIIEALKPLTASLQASRRATEAKRQALAAEVKVLLETPTA